MIVEKLIKIQSELKAPKNQRNNFGNYNYRSCEDILEAVKPLLAKQGVALTISDEVVQKSERYYVVATATLTDGTETISASAEAREPLTKKGMDDAQITGATSSYARKYALNGLFCIDDTKDPDATNTHGKTDDREEAKNKVLTTAKTKRQAEAKEAPKDLDVEIFKGLSETKTLDELKAYYMKHFKDVSDKKAFAEFKDMRKQALTEGEE